MQTTEREAPPRTVRQALPTGRARRRWLVAAAGAIAVAVAITAFVIVSGDDDPADVGSANLSTIEELQSAGLAGDYAAFQGLFADDATWRWIAAADSVDDNAGLLSDPAGALPVIFTYSDWDGDGVISDLDKLTSNEMIQYANGRSALPPCSLSGTQVVCDQPTAGAFWTDGNQVGSGTWTYTVEDGLIAAVEWEITPGGSAGALARAGEFNAWLQDNDPDLVAQLFVPFSGPQAAWVTPDNIEIFRDAVARWQAAGG